MNIRNQHTAMLLAMASFASYGASTSTPYTRALDSFKAKDVGDRLGAGTTDGKQFTDSRGRVYVRDDKGTIRRIKTP